MAKNELLAALYHAADSITLDWIFKTMWAVFISFITHTHTHLFAAFTALVVLDLLTKWIALSRQQLIDGGEENPSFWAGIRNIMKARKAGYIQSGPMKERFISKIFLYLLLTIASIFGDYMMAEISAPAFWAVLIVGYLSVCEMLSIVENLQAAGVEEAGKLQEIIRKKQEMLR